MLFFGMFLYLAGAAIWDGKTGRIPNRYLLVWLFVFAGYLFFAGELSGKAMLLSGCDPPERLVVLLRFCLFVGRILAGAIILFPLFFFRMMGAGDCKVMALLCGAMGVVRGFRIIFCGLAASAVWSFFYMVRKHMFLKRIRYFLNYMRRLPQMEEMIPYYSRERDGKEASFPLTPFLFLGYVLWLLAKRKGVLG